MKKQTMTGLLGLLMTDSAVAMMMADARGGGTNQMVRPCMDDDGEIDGRIQGIDTDTDTGQYIEGSA